jgi:hypothetical protein
MPLDTPPHAPDRILHIGLRARFRSPLVCCSILGVNRSRCALLLLEPEHVDLRRRNLGSKGSPWYAVLKQ